MAWSRAFQKCIIFHVLDKFFLQTFLPYTGFCDKKIQALSNDVSFVIFGHQTWDLEGDRVNGLMRSAEFKY